MYLETVTSILPLLPTLPQTSSSEGYTSTISLLGSHVTRAESLINSKIANRYNLSGYTFTNAPPILKTLTEDIAGYYILRSYYSADSQNISEWVLKFEEAVQLLDQLGTGQMNLTDSTGSLIVASTTLGDIESNTETFDPTFSENSPLTWGVDTSKF